MKISIARLVVCAVMGWSTTSTGVSSPPNILLILADDLGYGDVACFNSQSRIATPHLDWLAGEDSRWRCERISLATADRGESR